MSVSASGSSIQSAPGGSGHPDNIDAAHRSAATVAMQLRTFESAGFRWPTSTESNRSGWPPARGPTRRRHALPCVPQNRRHPLTATINAMVARLASSATAIVASGPIQRVGLMVYTNARCRTAGHRGPVALSSSERPGRFSFRCLVSAAEPGLRLPSPPAHEIVGQDSRASIRDADGVSALGIRRHLHRLPGRRRRRQTPGPRGCRWCGSAGDEQQRCQQRSHFSGSPDRSFLARARTTGGELSAARRTSPR